MADRAKDIEPLKLDMNHGSLFSGGGGFDLAAERMGWTNIFHCEKDPFCRTILNHYWPKAKTYEDIRKFDGTKYRGIIDIITGGFPCQPFSTAGQRRGTDDDRYLWPEMLRIIREIRPRWVVGENVHGILNWNAGLVFDQVHVDLEAEGYEIRAFVLPAAGVNAPHRRDRVWFVAHAIDKGRNTPQCAADSQRKKASNCKGADLWARFGGNVHPGDAAHANPQRLQPQAEIRELERERPGMPGAGDRWAAWPTQSPICSGNDGLPSNLDGITISKWRRESIKVFGNAVVPDVVYNIFSTIAAVNGLE